MVALICIGIAMFLLVGMEDFSSKTIERKATEELIKSAQVR